MMIGKSPYLVIGALIFGSIGCASQRPYNLFQFRFNAPTRIAAETSEQTPACDSGCDAPSAACDSPVTSGARRLGRFGTRLSHRRTAACDAVACDAPIPEPEPLEPDATDGTAAGNGETTSIEGASNGLNVPSQNLQISSGAFDSPAIPVAPGTEPDGNEAGGETDAPSTWQTPRSEPQTATTDDPSPAFVSSGDAESFAGTTQDTDEDSSFAGASSWPLDADANWEAQNSQPSEPTPVQEPETGSHNTFDFVPPTSTNVEANSIEDSNTESSPSNQESILERVATERAQIAAAQAQTTGSPQWIKNPFLAPAHSPTTPQNNVPNVSETHQPESNSEIVALNAIPKVQSVSQTPDSEIQSNRAVGETTKPDVTEAAPVPSVSEQSPPTHQDPQAVAQPELHQEVSSSSAQLQETEPQNPIEVASDSPADKSNENGPSDTTGELATANQLPPSGNSAAPTADPAGSGTSHQTTNVFVVVNVPPRKEANVVNAAKAMHAAKEAECERCRSHRSIVLRAIPHDRTGTCTTQAMAENLTIPPARPEPLAPLRGNRSIWAAEPVHGTPAHNVSFVRPADSHSTASAGQAPQEPVDQVNRGVRLRDLPSLGRMPQTPAPFVLPRTLNTPAVSADRSNVSQQRATEIERLPVRLHAIPQDGHGQPASTGTRARIRVIQPSYQRQVQPIDDAQIRNDQTRYAPSSLPSIDVDRFDRELRTLSQRPGTADETTVRR